MTKKSFLRNLKRELGALPGAERKKALDYYSEVIDDRIEAGFNEEAAVRELGDVGALADGVIAEAKERGVSMRMTAPWWIAGLVLGIACGVGLLFLVKYCFNNWDDKIAPKLGADTEWTEHTAVYVLSEGDSAIADLIDQDIYVGRSDDDMAHVTYYENKTVKFTVEMTENGLELKQNKEDRRWFNFLFNFGRNSRQAQILLPESFAGDIRVSVTTGDLRIDDLDTEGALVLSATTGDIIVYDVSAASFEAVMTTADLIVGRCDFAGGIKATATTGDMDIQQTEAAGDIDIHATTGDIDVKDCAAANAVVKVTTGDIEFDNVTVQSLTVNATTGHVELNNVTADTVSAKTTTGAVEVDELDAKDIKLKATTGVVGGTLVGSMTDYSINSHTTTGGNNLPDGFVSGDRKLDAETTTGAINITFKNNQ